MNRAKIERGHLIFLDHVGYDPAARGGIAWAVEDVVLWRHFDVQAALSDDLKLNSTRVNVRSVEATGSKETDRHARAASHKGRETLAVGCNEVSAISSLTLQCWVAEVEFEIFVFWDESISINCCVGDG